MYQINHDIIMIKQQKTHKQMIHYIDIDFNG